MCIYNLDIILFLDYDFKLIIIYGVGVIGFEYVSIFRGLGVKVDFVNMCDCLLLFFDDEILDVFSYYLWNNGVFIWYNEVYFLVEVIDDLVILNLELGKCMCVDCFLFVNGRMGNIDIFKFENIGLKVDGRG